MYFFFCSSDANSSNAGPSIQIPKLDKAGLALIAINSSCRILFSSKLKPPPPYSFGQVGQVQPFSPILSNHNFASECLEDFKLHKNIKWPDFDKSALEEEKINFVIQINGRKRAVLNEKKDIEETALLEKVKKDKILEKYLNKKEMKKIIFVKNRLMNILINE